VVQIHVGAPFLFLILDFRFAIENISQPRGFAAPYSKIKNRKLKIPFPCASAATGRVS
jgi:hypothetical protein